MAIISGMFFRKYAPWVVGGVAAVGLLAINSDLFFPNDGQVAEVPLSNDSPNVPAPDWVKDPSLWKERGQVAIDKYSKQDGQRAEGVAMLGEMLRWNWTTGYGVNLTGVDIGEVFAGIKMPDSKVSLLEYLGSSSARSGSFLISFAGSSLEGAIPPKVNIRGIDFSGAKASPNTWELWMKERAGRGMEGCNLAGVNLQGVNIHGVILKGANLSGTKIQPDFSDGLGEKFSDTQLHGVSFEGVDLAGVSLKYCDLSQTEITPEQLVTVAKSNGGGGLRGAILPKSDFSDKDVSGIAMQFANLTSVKMSGEQVKTIASQWNGMGLYGATLPVDHRSREEDR